MAAALERMFATMRSAYCAYAAAAPGGCVMEMPGVSAYVMPRIPERSFFNGVVYEDASSLEAALDDVAAAYDRAGVAAWTVWAHESDERASEILERAGHLLDASPAAMVLELSSIAEPPPVDGLEVEDGVSMEDALPVLESSYEVALDGRAGGWGTGTRPYLGRLDGRAASVLAIHDLNGDAGLYFVGTTPEARGRGVATRLVWHALRGARERGCDISTLQATRMGEPIYARLGYRTHGRVNMWERRRP